jgi:demethylmenaquinone methyltransferase/2-methoxy-6-polyprenyl-1,4-benzoquinol methylase
VNKEIQQMFSRIAPTYDKANRVLSMNQDVKWREKAVDFLAAEGFQPRRVLDLCAGTGDFALAVKKRFPDASVILTDFSKPMLNIARSKTKGLGDVTILTADAMKAPFCDMVFDAVVCGFGLRNLDDPQQGLKEIVRVLKPEGRAVILEFFRPEAAAASLIHNLYVKWVVPVVGGGISKSPDAYAYLPESTKKFFSMKETDQRMGAAGFKDVKAHSFLFGIATAVIGTRR